jgi:uncharacterized YkwD family protein
MIKARYSVIKKVFVAAIVVATLLMGGVAAKSAALQTVTAVPNNAKVLVNGSEISFESYGIDGYNYFRIRDIANVVKNTDKCFQVEWDGQRNAINLISDKAYSASPNSVSKAEMKTENAVPSSSTIYKDGKEINQTAYTINENNFIKLRDIGKAFNIGVEWDNSTRIIEIDTNKGYFETSQEAERNEIIISTEEAEVIRLVNIERVKAGLDTLETDDQLSRVAGIKSEDMVKKGYFNHISPTHGTPFEMMSTFECFYSCAGENIAMGQRSAAQVVTAWMNSAGHRANILNKDFSKIGVGLYQSYDGTKYWTQMFTD